MKTVKIQIKKTVKNLKKLKASISPTSHDFQDKMRFFFKYEFNNSSQNSTPHNKQVSHNAIRNLKQISKSQISISQVDLAVDRYEKQSH